NVTKVKNFARLLRRMADDRQLAIFVRRRHMKMQMLPEQQIVRLLIQRNIGRVIRVHEEVRPNLVISPASANERQMLFRNIAQLPIVAPHRCGPAAFQPRPDDSRILQGIKEHQLVVSQKWHDATAALKLQYEIQYAAAVRPAID